MVIIGNMTTVRRAYSVRITITILGIPMVGGWVHEYRRIKLIALPGSLHLPHRQIIIMVLILISITV